MKSEIMKIIEKILPYDQWCARIMLLVTFMAINYLALMPSSRPLPTTGCDKLNHFLAFFQLALLVDHSVAVGRFRVVKFGSLVAYGMSIEIIQFFVPSRSFSWYDLTVDVLAVAAYLVTQKFLTLIVDNISSWQDMELSSGR